jgi:hypothetical protein
MEDSMLAKRLGVALVLILLGARVLSAAEAYVVRFFAHSPLNSCEFIDWESEVVFHNTTTADARVRVLHVSSGGSALGEDELLVPAARTVIARGVLGGPATGLPSLWVARIDLPTGVVVQNRVEAWYGNCTLWPIPIEPTPTMGVFSLPVVGTLDPANMKRIHLGADLGGEHAYVNVGIYNASSETANATVELRQGCDDSVIATRIVKIAPDSVVQLSGLDGPSTSDCNFHGWIRYVAVSVDQPSFSYVVNKMYDLPQPPRIAYGSP